MKPFRRSKSIETHRALLALNPFQQPCGVLAWALVIAIASCTQRAVKTFSQRPSNPFESSAHPLDATASPGLASGDPPAAMPSGAVGALSPELPPPQNVRVDADPGQLAPSPTASQCRILVIGDSLSDPQSHGGGFLRPWLAHCPSCQVRNIARGGAMVNQMLGRLRHHLSETTETYTHWVVFGGVNDLYSDQTANRTVKKIERDLESIYQLGHEHRSLVVAVTVAPWGGFRRWYTEPRGKNTNTLNRWIIEQHGQGAVDIVVDSAPALTCGDSDELCQPLALPFHDGLHFGPKGHERLGLALLTQLGTSACAPNPSPN